MLRARSNPVRKVEVEFLYENPISKQVFATDGLENQFRRFLLETKGVEIVTPTTTKPLIVYVVSLPTSRLELGQNLSEHKIKDVLSGDDSCRMFILAVHSGMTADPIQFSSSYGDRIQVGQIVFSDRTGSPTLVSDARGVPLRECIDKLVTFLTPGTAQGTDGVNTGSGSSSDSHFGTGKDPASEGTAKVTDKASIGNRNTRATVLAVVLIVAVYVISGLNVQGAKGCCCRLRVPPWYLYQQRGRDWHLLQRTASATPYLVGACCSF